MTQAISKKPAVAQGILWGLFSGTATLTAFLFPIHIIAILSLAPPWDFDNPFEILYFGILYFSVIYHGLYRLKTILKDLKILHNKNSLDQSIQTLDTTLNKLKDI